MNQVSDISMLPKERDEPGGRCLLLQYPGR
jgi:hypothetical protein